MPKLGERHTQETKRKISMAARMRYRKETWKKSQTESSRDICECGDYRSQHDEKGFCSLNGLGHNIPNYRCEKFRKAF